MFNKVLLWIFIWLIKSWIKSSPYLKSANELIVLNDLQVVVTNITPNIKPLVKKLQSLDATILISILSLSRIRKLAL